MSLAGLAVYILGVSWLHYSSAALYAHLYVSPTGSDQNDGKTLQAAFKTISKALSQLSHAEYHNSNVFIELAPGYHDLDHTLYINTQGASQVTIRSLNGSEVHVTGGKRIPSNHFKHVNDPNILSRLPASARRNVRVVHLPDVGITSYPDLSPYGFHKTRIAPLEVFYNGAPLRLARWPNEMDTCRSIQLDDFGGKIDPTRGKPLVRSSSHQVSFVGYIRVYPSDFINIVGTPDGQNGLRFQYNSSVSRPLSWTHEQNIWTYGYWYWSWADRAVKVNHIDAHAHTVKLVEKTGFGLTTGHWGDPNATFSQQGGYFKFINVLSELDQPGEYYMDRASGNLYVLMPYGDGSVKASDVVYVSHLTHCINIHNTAHNVVLRDFTLEVCRGNGIVGYSVNNVQILNMEVRNTGGYNIKLQGDSRNCLISRCLLHDGDGGISIAGGSRNKLVSSGNLVEDNEIMDYAREGAVGYSAIALNGVGNIARYNHIYRGQYTAVRYWGNDHVMEFNHIHHVCQNASDCGALHTGRDWTARGNIIRYNIVHDTLRLVPGADVRGVMLDDQCAGSIITKNVFYNNHVHVNIGGGRDNIVSNNVMYDADRYSMQVDGRGAHHPNDGDLYRHLHAVPYNSTLWTTRYPALAGFDSKAPAEPRGNQINKNVVYNTPGKEFVYGLEGSLDKDYFFNATQNGFAKGPGDFYDVGHEDFRVKCLAADWANRVGFVQPPTPNEVGPRYGVGPQYKRKPRTTITLSNSVGVCTTNAPATNAPMPAYIPDGSRTNDIVNVSKHGCFLSVTKCTDHPSSHLYEDTYGEAHEHTGDNETACLARAAEVWQYCGSHKTDEITAVYGPTGAMTLAGYGCFFAMYGCPKHSGPADGHVVPGKIFRDSYGEQHRNGAHDENGCLSRAHDEWVWCGSHPNHPVTSLYKPSGASRTAGAGCWIHMLKCKTHPEMKTMFYDDWGATNKNTDASEEACFSRAQDFWEFCGSDSRYPVTTFYRPHAKSATYPASA